MSSHSDSPTQRVAVIVGASRGIGRQVSIDLAKAGYAVVLAAKSTSTIDPTKFQAPDPNSSESTITTVCHEITLLGHHATPISVDVRTPASISSLFSQTLRIYKRIDLLLYNSGAIWWESVAKTPLKRFQLMQRVNIEGLYACLQEVLPVFGRQREGRVIVVCPPIYSRFFRGKTAYAAGKVGMSVLVKGLAMDWEREDGKGGKRAVTGIWPAAAIESAATKQVTERDPSELRDLRDPRIFSDAILAILDAPTDKVNGLLAIDEDFLRDYKGFTDQDFLKYSKVPGAVPRRIMPKMFPDLTVEEQDDEGKRHTSTQLRSKL